MALARAFAACLLPSAASAAYWCMEAAFGSDPRYGDVQLKPCDGNPYQQWKLEGVCCAPSTYMIKSPPPPPSTLPSDAWLCLRTDSEDTGDGSRLHLGDCGGPPSSQGPLWQFVTDSSGLTTIQMQGASEAECVDAGDMTDGFLLMTWGCNYLSQQHWGVDMSGTIFLSESRRLRGGRAPDLLAEQAAAGLNLTGEAA